MRSEGGAFMGRPAGSLYMNVSAPSSLAAASNASPMGSLGPSVITRTVDFFPTSRMVFRALRAPALILSAVMEGVTGGRI